MPELFWIIFVHLPLCIVSVKMNRVYTL